MAGRPFRFGVTAPSVSSGAAWAEKARRAEQLGYSVVAVPDHFRDQLAPVPALTAAALATTRLRVGSLVFSNDFRHPVVLAKEAATLDLLSDGRFELGLGAGWLRAEYDQAGIPFDSAGTRIERLEEAVTLVKGLLSGERVTFTGRHYSIANLEGRPVPVQRPHPPILIGGEAGERSPSPRVKRRSSASSLGLLKDGSGLDRADFGEAALLQKLEWVRAAAGTRFDSLELNALIQAVVVSDHRTDAADQLASRFSVTRELVLETPYALLGTTDEICETVRQRRERYGISYLTVFERDMEVFAPVVARLAGT